MGISINALKSLLFARKNGIEFDQVITLGRQHFFVKPNELQRLLDQFGFSKLSQSIHLQDAFSEPLFKALGAAQADSMDFSSYEGATIIHDLNQPVSPLLHEKYDVVFDGGTLEHVFNFPQAIKNCMQMVKEGGHFISVTPCNNQMGHGFYQFSPELFYRIFSPENGFGIMKIFINSGGENGAFYEVKDPNEVRSRVTLTNSAETDMIIIACRHQVKEIFGATPQQSDYAATWKSTEEQHDSAVAPGGSIIKSIYQKAIPSGMRDRIWKLRYNTQHRQVFSDDLGHYNPKHFIKADF